jgi:hypothetical protein
MRRAQECMVVLHIDVDWLGQNTRMVVSDNPLLFAQRMQNYSGLLHNVYTKHKLELCCMKENAQHTILAL